MNNVIPLRSEARRGIALQYLALAARDLEQAKRARLRYIVLGREYGLTYGQIGAALGITEVAVRGLLRRNPDVGDA